MGRPAGTAIQNSPHLMAFIEAAADYIEVLDLASTIPLLIDSVPAVALDTLADQLSVLGPGGWALVSSEEEKRALLKKAIDLNRHAGTPWAVKTALEAIGYGGANITEGVSGYGPTYDGAYNYDEEINYADWSAAEYVWAVISVQVDLAGEKGISASETAAVVAVINRYKPARCALAFVDFAVNIVELAEMSDTLSYAQDYPIFEGATIYDGGIDYDGEIDYSGGINENGHIFVKNTSGSIIQSIDI